MMGLIIDTRIVGCGFLISLLFIILFVQQNCAQEGFVSYHCCALSNTTDPHTNITWISDDDLFQNKEVCKSVSIPVVNDASYEQVRIFGTSSGNKWCYNLTTIKGQDYLIRGTFLHGPILRTNSDTFFFNVSISATTLGRVNSLVDFFEVEGIFRATNDYEYFCLVRGKGNAYLSQLELRPLNDLGYLNTDPSSVLKVVKRADVGNTEREIRFPDDQNDRIWKIDASLNEKYTKKSNPSIVIKGAKASVPLQVLETALTDAEQLEFWHDDLDEGDNNYQIYLYFLELDDTVKSGERVFDIYANGEKKFDKFDILGDGSTSNYREIVLNVNANGFLNVTLIKVSGGADLGPICNAYEALQVRRWVQGTQQKDVDAIVELRQELVEGNPKNEILGGWSGDPCLPLPWERLLCESINQGFFITNLDLSSNDLQGSLPPIINGLTNLKHLNLSFNNLTGTIPQFPESSILMSMDVSHNELMGPFPKSLGSLPHLTRLDFGCNANFKDGLPSNLLRRSNLTTDSGICDGESSSSSLQKRIFIGSVAGGSLLFFVVVGIVFACFYRQRMLTQRRLNGREHPLTKNAVFSIPSMDDLSFKSIYIQTFTLECIETATHKYKTLIGEGGFGSVYRGTLPDGEDVAVKVRSSTSTQGTREFENELNLLSAIRHENLVPLLGYCCETDQQILVYPFMSNGSLQDRLYGEAMKRKTLDWQTRLSIALGAARGLLYLHTFAGRCVIHRDVKSSNILLDHSMTAKVADFGFSKYAPQEGDSCVSLEVRGTAGYLDPEYYSTQHLSAKSDVFSFGVVLLEIISGREPLNIHRPRNEWSLVEWAKPFIKDSRIEDIVDPSIKGGYHAETMWRVVEVALTCIEPFSAYRPSMADIVRELEDALIIENNASEYMKSIDSFGGSNRFSIEKKIPLPPTPSPTEASSIISQALTPPQPR